VETISPKFSWRPKDTADYRRTGFVLLKDLLTPAFVDYLRDQVDHQLETPTDHYQRGFDRLGYDLCEGDEVIYELLADEKFRALMRDLTGERLFFTQGVGFGMRKSVSTGFTWHIESQSFGFNRAEDYGTTLWIPLHRIDTKGQKGGMRYVPCDVISGHFMYTHVDPAVFRCMAERIENGDVAFDEYVKLRDEPLNSSGICRLLEYYAVEDDFELGDALLFDKWVIHRSAVLEDGPLDVRSAFSLRFISEESRYDYQRAHDIEIPRNYFGYAGPTKFHLEVCKEDGELIVNSPLFAADRNKRRLSDPETKCL
jgi:hypothetical protein